MTLNADQVRRLHDRCTHHAGEPIQDILPEVPQQVREIFITGQTPAEWDEVMNDGRKHWRYYVENFGYIFGGEDSDPEYRDQVDRDLPRE